MPVTSGDRSKKALIILGALLISSLLAYQFKMRSSATKGAPVDGTAESRDRAPDPADRNTGTTPGPGAPLVKGADAVIQSALPVPTSSVSKGIPGYAKKPQGSVVEFELKDGYAVAFGDLVLGKPPADFDQLRGLAEVARPNLWLRGEVPYVIQTDLINPERVQAAIQMFHQSTGLKFVPHSNQTDAIAFTQSDEHCSSYLGRVGGLQPIFLSEKCTPADIAHEMMHALGFVHEQSRTDRDQFVVIEWDNIQDKYQNQFAIVPDALMEAFGDSPFDPASLLMYGRNAFAVNPTKPVMKLRSGAEVHLAPKGLSDSDIERVNRLYRE